MGVLDLSLDGRGYPPITPIHLILVHVDEIPVSQQIDILSFTGGNPTFVMPMSVVVERKRQFPDVRGLGYEEVALIMKWIGEEA